MNIAAHIEIVKQALADERQRSRRLTEVHETAFLPAALEVVERPVSPTARTTARLLLGGLAILILWMILGRVDVVATAPGKIVPAENVKLIQPADTGVVNRILVHDGQRVRKGQVLLVLDPTATAADLEQSRKALESAELAAARARAVLAGLYGSGFRFVAPEGVDPLLATMHRDLALAQLRQVRAGISMRSAGSLAAAAQVAEARGQAAKLTETIPLLKEQLEANEKLLEKGFVSKLRVIEMRRQYLGAIRDRDIALKSAAGAGANYVSAASGAAQTQSEARQQLLAELAKTEDEVALRREDYVKNKRRSTLTRMVSPVDGTVSQLAVHTEGGVVEAAKPVMAIVPSGGHLVVEASLLNRDVGFVSVGQEVAVKLESFPFTRYGTIRGVVKTIGSDAVVDEHLGPVYPIRVALDKATVDRGDREVPILPGMAAQADIRTGRRSFMSYLVSPIEKARLEAARER